MEIGRHRQSPGLGGIDRSQGTGKGENVAKSKLDVTGGGKGVSRSKSESPPPAKQTWTAPPGVSGRPRERGGSPPPLPARPREQLGTPLPLEGRAEGLTPELKQGLTTEPQPLESGPQDVDDDELDRLFALEQRMESRAMLELQVRSLREQHKIDVTGENRDDYLRRIWLDLTHLEDEGIRNSTRSPSNKQAQELRSEANYLLYEFEEVLLKDIRSGKIDMSKEIPDELLNFELRVLNLPGYHSTYTHHGEPWR